MTNIDVDAIIEESNKHKPTKHDQIVSELVSLFEDGADAQALLASYLKRNGLGLSQNDRPLQFGLLSYLVSRTATRYSFPASRRLKRNGELLADTDPEQLIADRVYADLGWDAAMQKADKLAALTGTAFIRVYPGVEGLSARVFPANRVHRIPHHQSADKISMDSAIVLETTAGYEVHLKEGDQRLMFMLDSEGAVLPGSVYGESGVMPPEYGGVLPIIRLDSASPVGDAWLTPKASRVSYGLALGGLQADLQALAALQAHSLMSYTTDDPARDPPDTSGPGSIVKLHTEERIDFLTPSPKIDSVRLVFRELLRTFMMGEAVPVQEVDGVSVLTGAALKVAERGMASQRLAGIPVAIAAETRAWNIIKTLQRAHCDPGQEIGEDTEISVSLVTSESPQDETGELSTVAQEIALGLSSLVDGAQRILKLNRAQAITRLKRVQEDMADFPLHSQVDASRVPAARDTINSLRNAEGMPSTDSTLDAARGVSSAEAREARHAAEAGLAN